MRNLKYNKRKLYSVINKAGLATTLVGASGIVLSTIPEDLNIPGVAVGFTLVTAGIYTHLIMHNKEYQRYLMDEDLLSKKRNSFYRTGLIKEQEKLDSLELYLDDVLTDKDEEEIDLIKEDLYSDQLLVEKELEILDLDIDEETEKVDEYYEYIDFLKEVPKSEEYLSIKNKFLQLNKEIYTLPNANKKKKNKILKIINKE